MACDGFRGRRRDHFLAKCAGGIDGWIFKFNEFG
jgi:hypothetical protein